jgi:hypothetical protein
MSDPAAPAAPKVVRRAATTWHASSALLPAAPAPAAGTATPPAAAGAAPTVATPAAAPPATDPLQRFAALCRAAQQADARDKAARSQLAAGARRSKTLHCPGELAACAAHTACRPADRKRPPSPADRDRQQDPAPRRPEQQVPFSRQQQVKRARSGEEGRGSAVGGGAMGGAGATAGSVYQPLPLFKPPPGSGTGCPPRPRPLGGVQRAADEPPASQQAAAGEGAAQAMVGDDVARRSSTVAFGEALLALLTKTTQPQALTSAPPAASAQPPDGRSAGHQGQQGGGAGQQGGPRDALPGGAEPQRLCDAEGGGCAAQGRGSSSFRLPSWLCEASARVGEQPRRVQGGVSGGGAACMLAWTAQACCPVVPVPPA